MAVQARVMKSAFDEAPLTLHGIFGRPIGEGYSYSFDGYEYGEAPILLTRCLIMHRSYADVFLEAAPSATELIARGSPKWNGEDIFLSMLSIRRSNRLPRAYDLPFKDIWHMTRESISKSEAPAGDEVKLSHRPYRSWFTREAIRLLGVEAQIDQYLSQT